MSKRYPRDFSDQELKDKIYSYADYPVGGNNEKATSNYTKAIIGLVELQGRESRKVTVLSFFISITALLVTVYGVYVAYLQTHYTEIQSRSDRIMQAQSIQRAKELCKSLPPDSTENGLYNVLTGDPVSCSQILK